MKLLKIFISIFFVQNFFIGISQNLVPNPSFEEYNCLPEEQDQLSCCKYWYDVGNTTPDYCHRNSPAWADGVRLPQTWLGKQEPYIGDAFCQMHINFSLPSNYEKSPFCS